MLHSTVNVKATFRLSLFTVSDFISSVPCSWPLDESIEIMLFGPLFRNPCSQLCIFAFTVICRSFGFPSTSILFLYVYFLHFYSLLLSLWPVGTTWTVRTGLGLWKPILLPLPSTLLAVFRFSALPKACVQMAALPSSFTGLYRHIIYIIEIAHISIHPSTFSRSRGPIVQDTLSVFKKYQIPHLCVNSHHYLLQLKYSQASLRFDVPPRMIVSG